MRSASRRQPGSKKVLRNSSPGIVSITKCEHVLGDSEIFLAHPGFRHVQGLFDEIEHFVDLVLTDDQWWAERQGIAHRPADPAQAFEELNASRADHRLGVERRLSLF